MSKFLNSIFLSLSTNIDNLSVGITFGTSREFGFDANLIIAVLSFVSTFVSMLLGAKIAPYVPQSSGALILFIIGMFMTYSAYYDTENNSNDSDLESSSTLKLKTKSRVSLKEAFILGLGLTFTNFGTGFGGGIAKLDGNKNCLSFFKSFIFLKFLYFIFE